MRTLWERVYSSTALIRVKWVPVCVTDAPRMIAGNTVVLSLCFSQDTGAVLSLLAQLQALGPALIAATDILLLSDPDGAVGGLASY